MSLRGIGDLKGFPLRQQKKGTTKEEEGYQLHNKIQANEVLLVNYTYNGLHSEEFIKVFS